MAGNIPPMLALHQHGTGLAAQSAFPSASLSGPIKISINKFADGPRSLGFQIEGFGLKLKGGIIQSSI